MFLYSRSHKKFTVIDHSSLVSEINYLCRQPGQVRHFYDKMRLQVIPFKSPFWVFEQRICQLHR